MCGIGGLVGVFEERVLIETGLSMQQSLRHRGPDDQGVFVVAEQGVLLVHTRLAILDLSPTGHQPMASDDGRYTIVFNGEIYNYRELKQRLIQRGQMFHGDSDTEVLLHLYATDGPAMVGQLAGMFAFAIWDRVTKSVFMARDPLGVKPLYFSLRHNRLAFASELRTLVGADLTSRAINRNALAKFLLFGSVQESDTLLEGVETLPAGHTLSWHDGVANINAYWQPTYGAAAVDRNEAVQQTRAALEESVSRHFVSDVPVGVFLSGGMDSTALIALAKATGRNRLKTFCISFNEESFNEGQPAARTARHFDTEHYDWRLTATEGQSLISDYLECLDQPSNDGFNSYCVSRFAAQSGMKVVLSGLGGDELFGSYPSFKTMPRLLSWHERMRSFGVAGQVVARHGLGLLSQIASDSRAMQAKRLEYFFRSQGKPLTAYWAMRSFFLPSETQTLVGMITGDDQPLDFESMIAAAIPVQPTAQDEVAYLETTRYMRNQLLRDADVMSMANGLELRVPLVDQRLFDVVAQYPANIRLAAGKQLLHAAVPEIPDWVAGAPKRGFSFPFQAWFGTHWIAQFDDLERRTPMRLGTWYRTWSLFALQHCLRRFGASNW